VAAADSSPPGAGDLDQEGTARRLSRWPGQAWTSPAMTHQKPPRLLPLLFWDAHNPLIRHYFLWVFRFAQMALADARI
jgi:hypothetical protein